MYYLIKGSTLVGKADIAPNIEDLRQLGVETVEDIRDLDISTHEYVDGQFVEAPVIECIPTKEEKIAYIKKYYDSRFATLYKVLAHRQLINGDITDLQEQCKQLNLEMVAKIKEIQYWKKSQAMYQ